MNLILATTSQFRIAFYEKLGFEVQAIASDEKEFYSDRSDPIKYVEELSKIKAHSVASRVTNGVVIGTDTVAVLDGKILEKPKTIQEAMENMRRLQGRENLAISGITIYDKDQDICETLHEITRVTFSPMSEEEIEWYIQHVPNVLQCAGYSVSTEGGRFVSKIDGDYYNIFGAPVSRVYQELKRLGSLKLDTGESNHKVLVNTKTTSRS